MPSLAETPEYQAFQRFIALTLERREIEARLRELKESLKAMQPSLLAYLAAAQMPMLALGAYEVRPRRDPWIYPLIGVSRERVCEALKIAGLSRMVKENYSTQSLTAYLKQLEERSRLIAGAEEPGADDEGLRRLLHPALAEIMHVKAAYSLLVTRKDSAFARDIAPENEGDYDE
jgi:hypothetical protein